MKKYIPYIREFIIFLFVVSIFTIIIISGNYIQIIIKPHFLSYLILVSFAFSILYLFRQIIFNGVMATIDCLFRTTCEEQAIFEKVHQGFGSAFSDRFTGESTRSSKCEIRYTYVFKGKKYLQLKSTQDFALIPNKKYRVKYGRFSKVILSIS